MIRINTKALCQGCEAVDVMHMIASVNLAALTIVLDSVLLLAGQYLTQ